MAQSDDDKAKLYKRIIGAPVHRVLERMRVLGYWPSGMGLPPDPSDEASERAKIEQELVALRATHSKVADPLKALRQERVRRWQESKKKRAAAHAALLERLKKRREEWAAYRKTTIVHAGEGVSAGLQKQAGDPAVLLKRGLPVIQSAPELAAALGLTLPKLRWLTFHRRAVTLVHYRRYGIPKKTGGVRNISAPKPLLAKAQRWVFDNVLAKLSVEEDAHGFVLMRSILSNALPHVKRAVVVNMDLKDFFPSITFRRVKGLFAKLGYNEHVATLLALLCTEPPRVEGELDGKVYYVALSERQLPQGACTSPAITNALCRKLDRRLRGLAKRHGASYTRYADDLTFSTDDPSTVGKLLKSVRGILEAEGFAEHEDKTRVMRRGRRQVVTGVVVNQKPSLPRDELRQLRAIVHNVAKKGLASQNRDGLPNFEAHLRGRIAFVNMLDPKRARALWAELDRALGKAAAAK